MTSNERIEVLKKYREKYPTTRKLYKGICNMSTEQREQFIAELQGSLPRYVDGENLNWEITLKMGRDDDAFDDTEKDEVIEFEIEAKTSGWLRSTYTYTYVLKEGIIYANGSLYDDEVVFDLDDYVSSPIKEKNKKEKKKIKKERYQQYLKLKAEFEGESK